MLPRVALRSEVRFPVNAILMEVVLRRGFEYWVSLVLLYPTFCVKVAQSPLSCHTPDF
jgi:hypothetical protein